MRSQQYSGFTEISARPYHINTRAVPFVVIKSCHLILTYVNGLVAVGSVGSVKISTEKD